MRPWVMGKGKITPQTSHTLSLQLHLHEPRQMGHPFARVQLALNEGTLVLGVSAQEPIPHLRSHLKGGGTYARPQPCK